MVLLGPWALWISEMWAADHVRQILEHPQREQRLAAALPSRSTCSRPFSSHASASSGATSGRSIGTRPVPMTTPTRSGSSRVSSRPLSRTARPAAADAEAHGPAHDLEALAVLARHERRDVEVGHLGRDLDRMAGGVEGADRPDAAAPVDARLPERFLADAVGGDHSQPGHDHSAHGRALGGGARRPVLRRHPLTRPVALSARDLLCLNSPGRPFDTGVVTRHEAPLPVVIRA